MCYHNTMNPIKFFFWCLLLVPTSSWANDCRAQFANRVYPVYSNPSFSKHARLFCFQEFTVYWSGLTRTPLFVGEHLHPSRMKRAQPLTRQGEFVEEPSLGVRGARLQDYRRSGFDRGHMAPSGNMSTYSSQQESFNLVNIIPQNSTQNRNQWAKVEQAVRNMAFGQQVFVITGVLFEGQTVQSLNNRVLIPTSVYKVVYLPAAKQAAAYVLGNHDTARLEYASVEQLERRAHLSFGLGPTKRLHLPSPARVGEKR